MGRPRKQTQTEAPKNEPEHQEEDWGSENEAAERREAEEGDAEDDAEDGEEFEDEGAGDGEGNPEEDLAAVSRRQYDDEPEVAFKDEASGDGLTIGAALTDRQTAGIDPVDAERSSEEAGRRARMQNAQTTHERQNALDPVSGTANPGITENHGHSAPGSLGASDMSGNAPKADPLAAAGPQVQGVMDMLSKASQKAMRDGKAGQGYVSLSELNVHKSVMDALVSGGHVIQDVRPGGTFSPETGTVYRHAAHREPNDK